jgi:hypothetical protein
MQLKKKVCKDWFFGFIPTQFSPSILHEIHLYLLGGGWR